MTSAAPDRSLMSIGEVLASVRRDFPEVTISKIRFLESEGLVEPARTPSGYRKFSRRDVERLRYVLSAQRDQYLPLRVIKEHLDAIDRGLEPPDVPGGRPRVPEGLGDVADNVVGAWAFRGDASEVRLSRSELMSAAGLDAGLLDQIEEYGLIAPRPGTAHYDADALVVARTVAEMQGYGLEPRHLRAFRTGAEREAGLVEQVVAPLLRQRDAEANSRAEEVAREMGALSVKLHTALVRVALRAIVRG
jgi:DNA-binding transcriptional MerR regulator